jgi:hypothetical protein
MMKTTFAITALGMLVATTLIVVGPGAAQQRGAEESTGADAARRNENFAPHGGGMHGPWSMGPQVMGLAGRAFCDERLARMAQWRLARIERAVRPTEAQRAAFEDFKSASLKAVETTRAACPTERFLTPTGRLEAAEKQLTARLEAVRTIRPALQTFYGALNDEQKARFNTLGRGPHRFAQEQQRQWRPSARNDEERGGRQWNGPRPDEQGRNEWRERRRHGGSEGNGGNRPSASPEEERL